MTTGNNESERQQVMDRLLEAFTLPQLAHFCDLLAEIQRSSRHGIVGIIVKDCHVSDYRIERFERA